jgi:hypothetical protein
MNAGLGLLREQNKAVGDTKNTMETDYNRISSRYNSLFENIDNECYKLAFFHSCYFTVDTNLSKRVSLPGPAMFLQKILDCDLIPFNST